MGRNAKSHPSRPHLVFLGAAGTVTGSRFLIETERARILVDCGMFQGKKELRLQDWEPFPVDPRSIDAVVLTHAHIDHSGFLPGIASQGFQGRIFATSGTSELCSILLPDCGFLLEQEATYANKVGFSKHRPARPLYTEQQAQATLRLFAPTAMSKTFTVAPGIKARFEPAGHILGAASVAVEIDGELPRRLTFTGDVGRPHHPLLVPPKPIGDTDILITESTYGDRIHEDEQALLTLERTINETIKRGGNVIIPAFAVDRTEVLLYHLKRLVESKRIRNLPIFADSPLALKALGIYRQAIAQRNPEIRPEIYGLENPFDPGNLIEAKTVDESKAIRDHPYPCIIISASGMATGGRVLHHLAHGLPDPRNTVILVGFQAERTRGRSLLDGTRTLKLLGRYVPVRAEIVEISAYSVHADANELIAWLAKTTRPPEMTYIVHGEPDAAKALSARLEQELHWPTAIPQQFERVRLDLLQR